MRVVRSGSDVLALPVLLLPLEVSAVSAVLQWGRLGHPSIRGSSRQLAISDGVAVFVDVGKSHSIDLCWLLVLWLRNKVSENAMLFQRAFVRY